MPVDQSVSVSSRSKATAFTPVDRHGRELVTGAGYSAAMTRTLVRYRCQSCGHESPKWLGRCTQCEEWGSLEAVERPSGERVPEPGRHRPRSRCPSPTSTPSARPGGPPTCPSSTVCSAAGSSPARSRSSAGSPAWARARWCCRRWARWRPTARAACSCAPRSRRRRCGSGPTGSARSRPTSSWCATRPSPTSARRRKRCAPT